MIEIPEEAKQLYKGYIQLCDTSGKRFDNYTTEEQIEQEKKIAKTPSRPIYVFVDKNGVVCEKNTPGAIKTSEFDKRNVFDDISGVKEKEKGIGAILDDDIVMMDFDDNDSATVMYNYVKEKNIKCIALWTYTHDAQGGLHLYFRQPTKRPSTCYGFWKNYLCCGMYADCKSGVTKDGVGKFSLDVLQSTYENKIKKKRVYEVLTDDGTLDELPPIMWDCSTKEGKKLLNETYEGARNSTLSALGQTITGYYKDGITYEDWKDILYDVNEYVMPEPLDDNEVEIIARYDAYCENALNYDKKYTIKKDIITGERKKEINLSEIPKITETNWRVLLPKKISENEEVKELKKADMNFALTVNNDGKVRQWDYQAIADYISEEYNVCYIDNELYIYDVFDKIYTNNINAINDIILKTEPRLENHDLSQVITRLKALAYRKGDKKKEHKKAVGFLNGTLHLDTWTFTETTKEDYLISKLPHNYNPEAFSEYIDREMNLLSENDNDIQNLMYQMAGYGLDTENDRKTIFILVSKPNGGKSVLCKLISEVYGEFRGVENITRLTINDIGSNRFAMASLVNAKLNIGNELDFTKPIDSATCQKMKALSGGDAVSVDQKFQKIIGSVKLNTKHIYTSNGLISFDDPTIQSRIQYIDCPGHFENAGDKNRYLLDYIFNEDSVEYFMIKMISAYRRVQLVDGFDIPDTGLQKSAYHHMMGNSIEEWLDDLRDNKMGILSLNKKKPHDAYKDYEQWCRDEKYAFSDIKGYREFLTMIPHLSGMEIRNSVLQIPKDKITYGR